ncbi:MAG: type II CRISPR-associated endonuclease Cas1 [Puniceicoccales bacterium]|jgi:CRISPR-associated protein Cas1|nr:type II CRISPR-associated endonuclease Cas1 [Puniceicoccales bacterium]
MSYHIVTIDSPKCELTCERGQLLCFRDGEVTPKQLPIEDIGAIIVTSFAARFSASLLLEAAKNGVALVLCENFKPASLVLPANRASDTFLTKAWQCVDKKFRAALWRKTIDAKCANQAFLATNLAPAHPKTTDLARAAARPSAEKESACARFYWQVFASLSPADAGSVFMRDPEIDGTNALLNYGYAVLLSTVLQKLFAIGLDPTFGIGHAVRERSTPLAYDLMEPFRPCVDLRVLQWLRGEGAGQPPVVTREFKQWVTGFVLERVGELEIEIDVRGAIEGVARSFRNALLNRRLGAYKPWTASNTKWAGSL